MTVSDLIEELQKMPSHWPIVIETMIDCDEIQPVIDVYEIVELKAMTGKEVHGMACIHIVTEPQ